MKKIVTLFFAFLVCYGAFAQVKNATPKHINVSKKIIVDDGSSTEVPPPYRNLKDVEVITLTTSGNVWSTMEAQANQVMYDASLNTVIHGHRSETFGGSGNTNHLYLDYSTDGGLTWTNDVDLTPSAGDASRVRYPQVTIVNPEGGTPQVVGCGWDVPDYKFFTTVANMDGSGASDQFNALSTGHNYGVPTGLSADADGTKAYCSVIESSAEGNKTDKICLLDADVSAGSISWNETYINLALNPSHTYNWVFSKDMAFSKVTPGLGYAAATFCDGDNQFPDDIQPGLHIWKTTDAGANWTRLPAFDYSTLQLFQDSLVSDAGQPIRPFFNDFSLAVDANGKLHIAVQIYSGSDETFSYWPNPEDEPGHYSHIFDLITEDGESFEAVWVAPFISGSYDYFPGEDVFQGTYIETVLSNNSDKISFVWSETIGEDENTAPDIKAIGMNVNSGAMTDVRVLTEGTDAETAAYFAFTSSTAIEDGDDFGFQIPIVYCEPGDTDLSPIQYYYITGVGLDFPSGVSTVNEVNFEVFPNPATDIVTVSNTGTSNIKIYNITGAEVLNLNSENGTVDIDVSDLSNGTYFIKVENENNTSTEKLIIVK